MTENSIIIDEETHNFFDKLLSLEDGDDLKFLLTHLEADSDELINFIETNYESNSLEVKELVKEISNYKSQNESVFETPKEENLNKLSGQVKTRKKINKATNNTQSYSHYILPFSILIQLGIINSILFFMTPNTYTNLFSIIYFNILWLLITHIMDFYHIARMEKFTTNMKKLFYLCLFYGLGYFSWFGIRNQDIDTEYQMLVYFTICSSLIIYRWFFFQFIKNYRISGGNYAKVVVIGRDKSLKKIRKVFDNPQFGYRYCGFFDDVKSNSLTYLGSIIDCFNYILDNEIDEIYCTASKLSKPELQNLINFADNNLIKLKIIPDNKEIFTPAMTVQKYDKIPVLDLRTIPLDASVGKIAKRVFDILFSSIVILGVLSWLIPILFILIKLESPGPLFIIQKRNGLKRKVFNCIKFRSMTFDDKIKKAIKADIRVTRIGKFLRRTSIDELPQFFNVFIGDMSVVGPRAHMEKHTSDYEISVDKYLVRHSVKPGITGLAQIKGYRGEIIKPSDILNRIKFDILYIEKWSITLDLKIIVETIIHFFKGDNLKY